MKVSTSWATETIEPPGSLCRATSASRQRVALAAARHALELADGARGGGGPFEEAGADPEATGEAGGSCSG